VPTVAPNPIIKTKLLQTISLENETVAMKVKAYPKALRFSLHYVEAMIK